MHVRSFGYLIKWCLYDQQFSTKAFIFHEYVSHAELFIHNLRHVRQQVLRADPTMYILKLFFFVNLASIIFFGNTCSMNFATSQAIYGGSLFFPRIRRRAAYLCIKRGKPASYKDHLTPGRAVRGEKNMLSGSLLKFNFYDFRKRFATLSVVWDKLFCKFRISVYTFHHCFYGAYAGKTNKNMRNENYILVKI